MPIIARNLIYNIISDAISEINDTRHENISVNELDNISLYGDSGVFDSMGLVNFLVLVEEKLDDKFNLVLSLTSERAVSRRISPFRNIVSLVDFILEEIEPVAAS
ncbi:hypothetical protein WGT02_32095 (plasmid) [Rhizobium sp. T1470]|uniref:hypothetical protein n=1 Tax=unclassified Rhizobium TaxID=2613769 RepID=UPI001AAEFADD|nr:hypothetical protein [Rhizobium sp. T1473]MCA0806503.1 hypothetical protein [Rhizobium sp. T1473]